MKKFTLFAAMFVALFTTSVVSGQIGGPAGGGAGGGSTSIGSTPEIVEFYRIDSVGIDGSVVLAELSAGDLGISEEGQPLGNDLGERKFLGELVGDDGFGGIVRVSSMQDALTDKSVSTVTVIAMDQDDIGHLVGFSDAIKSGLINSGLESDVMILDVVWGEPEQSFDEVFQDMDSLIESEGVYYRNFQTDEIATDSDFQFSSGAAVYREFTGYLWAAAPIATSCCGTESESISDFCRRLFERINNLKKKIKQRISELREDPLGLPETHPNDHVKPSLSKRGHRRLINIDKATLARRIAEYRIRCGPIDGYPRPVPVLVPEVIPEVVPEVVPEGPSIIPQSPADALNRIIDILWRYPPLP